MKIIYMHALHDVFRYNICNAWFLDIVISTCYLTTADCYSKVMAYIVLAYSYRASSHDAYGC